MSEANASAIGRSHQTYVGINIGAITVKAVALTDTAVKARVEAHQGRPLDVLRELLTASEFVDADFFGVCGNAGHISEASAIQRALKEVDGGFDAVASLGGESFLVYTLKNGRITNVLSHNKCAAGSGEFFIQQISRMGLGIDEAIRRSFAGRVVPLASRCSVHCKSDITHKLNRNEATPEDILHTLHDSMANKVIALLDKTQLRLRRVLLIGGLTRNPAMAAALQGKLEGVEFVVLPESPWFEAWGSALLTRDQPVYKTPNISAQAGVEHLPPLNLCSDKVRAIPAPPREAPGNGPFVLGVDAGSTTTKMTLLDAATRQIVASHYGRTRGDPISAIRECLRALIAEAGNVTVGLIATTGSARELAGAYLGTEHVYNEISAHAAGAAHFDPTVDTIFEIGGQDSKYIYLRNGVPIEYAMNNACSAGTGSFLEESSQSDLGIAVSDISNIALAAPTPAHFKATCAAFINSDIRAVQQQGQSREDIVAGLVYAIAGNYLNRVKGPRPVGKKVFLQGGVALNHAVGHAFAQISGREVVIPAEPELLGALGVGLLAMERSSGTGDSARNLAALAAPEMKLVGRFTCGACKMYCTIDRFEVSGRKFPFGGRCSLYENVWKKKTRTAAARDLVELRSELLFGKPRTTQSPAGHRSVGIPKALTTHSLFPLYSTFFSALGFDVVLSDVDSRGELKTYSGFCFPAQIAHGAVLDLLNKGVKLIFLPHVLRMPQSSTCQDSYLCPITQASPYFLAKAFPEMRFLSPLLDFSDEYDASRAMVEMATHDLGVPEDAAKQAWALSVDAQMKTEQALRDLGQEALNEAITSGKPAIVLAGHSYNAFTPEGSQSVAKKLSSMGVTVIPADCIASTEEGPTAWHFANQIMNAVALVKKQPNLFLLCVSNFSCTIDAFTQSLLASELGSKPYLILEIDAHTADAGVQTRLEAFLDIIHNWHGEAAASSRVFTPCRIVERGDVIRSNGERVPIRDPRVKIYVPNFSEYHSDATAMAARWMGLHTGTVPSPEKAHLERGLQHTSGRECLPLPICIGQLLQIHERRQPGEIAGFYMPRGGAPCVMDSYHDYFERFIAEQKLPDLFLVDPRPENDYLGVGEISLARLLAPAVIIADILLEIDHVVRVVSGPDGVESLSEGWRHLVARSHSPEEFQEELPIFVDRLAALPRNLDPQKCPRVLVTGDFFTRFSPFFMEGVRDLYAAKGIILKAVDLSDFYLYMSYSGVAGSATHWQMKPGGLALARACTRIFQPDGKQYLQHWLNYQIERWSEQHYRAIFAGSGLLIGRPNDAPSVFQRASEHVSPKIYGEIIPTIGKGLAAASEGYDGLIVIGPFNCLPFRISEAILKPLCIQDGMPLLTYESDGYAVVPSVLRQVEVHIQQVLEHHNRAIAA